MRWPSLYTHNGNTLQYTHYTRISRKLRSGNDAAAGHIICNNIIYIVNTTQFVIYFINRYVRRTRHVECALYTLRCRKIKYVFCTYVVQFVVETASVANGFAVLVSPPQRRGGRFAIRTARPGSTGSRLQGL